MTIPNKKHYAYIRTYYNYNDAYDGERTEYVVLQDIEEVKRHYLNYDKLNGTYVKVTPLKFTTTVEVKE